MSDASVFAKMTHTSSRCWGVIWGIIAVASLAAAIYFNLLVGKDEGDSLDSFSDASTETKVVLSVAVVIVALSILHTGLTRRCTALQLPFVRSLHFDFSPFLFVVCFVFLGRYGPQA
jgi:hypothetical protein